MYSVSSAFLTALKSSNMVSAVTVTTSNGYTLFVKGGKVDMDSNRDIGRIADCEFVPTSTMTTDQIFTILTTPGVEITISRGLTLDIKTELVPLGVFSTDQAEVSKSVTATVKWSGSDRSKKIARARWTDPYQIASGTTLASAGTALLQSRVAGISCDFSNVQDTIQATHTYDAGADSNPWKNAKELFWDHGYDLRFDGRGIARAYTIPDPATVATAFDFGAGTTSMILDGTQTVGLETVYNGVIATGEGSEIDPPVRAEVWDTDPTSPTYYLSGFGKVPYFFSSPMLTTQTIANKTAASILARVKGRFQKLVWPSIVNPALEPFDVVTVTFWGKTYKSILDAIIIPLGANEAMSASARQTSIT